MTMNSSAIYFGGFNYRDFSVI